MSHEVILTQRAQEELQESHDWWARHHSPLQATNWYTGFLKAMCTLEASPGRCPLADENGQFPYEIRQLTFGLGRRPSHRAVFTIRADQVVVLRIRHVAQQPLGAEEE